MVSLLTLLRYSYCKAEYIGSLLAIRSMRGHFKGDVHNFLWKKYEQRGHLKGNLPEFFWKQVFHARLTFLYWNKEEGMNPTIAGKEATLLVRKVPIPNPWDVFVGDVVVLENPEKPDDYLVRRVAAIEGYEMASTDENDEPFVLGHNECWVLAENEKVKAKEAIDSRTLGPVHMSYIVGRVIYCLQSAADHGRVQNSHFGMRKDSPVLKVELEVDEMVKSHKANFSSEN